MLGTRGGPAERVDAPADGVVPHRKTVVGSGRDTLSAMDTHATVGMLTAAAAGEVLAGSVVDVAQDVTADPRTRVERSRCARRTARRAPGRLVALEARLTWRFAGAPLVGGGHSRSSAAWSPSCTFWGEACRRAATMRLSWTRSDRHGGRR